MSNMDDLLKEEVERQKERKEKSGGNFQTVDWYKPKVGVNKIRIMPHWKNPGEKMFFKRVVIHFGIEILKDDGSGTVPIPARCLREFKKICPICDKYYKGDKSVKTEMSQIRPQEKYLYNIFDIGEKKLYVYSAPITVHQLIFDWVGDLGGDITDLDAGYDFKLIKEVEKGKDPKYGTKYGVRPFLTPSKFPEKCRIVEVEEDGNKVKKPILEAIYDIDELYKEDHEKAIYKAAKVAFSSDGSSPTIKEDEENEEDEENSDSAWGESEEEEEIDLPFSQGSSDDEENTESLLEDETSQNEEELNPEDVGIDIENDDLQKELEDLGIG